MARDGHRGVRRAFRRLAPLLAAITALAAPSLASAAVETQTFRTGPIAVAGYEVQQNIQLAPSPDVNGFITRMDVDIVDAEGNPIPIQRLMLHHIVFANLSRPDKTCDSIMGFDNQTPLGFAPDRFYGAGEERAKLALPDGYGYPVRASDEWGLVYMVMNHLSDLDEAYIQYTVTTDTDPSLTPVDPYWLDVENCHSDPIYNVPGTGEKGSTHTKTADFTFPQAGRIIAGGGHVHGGARRLTLTEPGCGNREVARSTPTWGSSDHPFYNVRPILHEPGPVNMSGFTSQTGIPVEAGQTIRLNSEYENSRPHTRVMGINVVYFAEDPSVTDGCGPLPTDVQKYGTSQPGTHAPVPFEVPLTGLDDDGNAIEIGAPPGKLERMREGGTVTVGDRFFSEPNIEVRKGAEIEWDFKGSELHNVTLANGPVGIGSPNLDDGRTYSRKLKKKGTYRLFCALHPVQMQERVVVKGRK
ncbi:MAG TPA: plastocyanin/azurin family copper-binding protein [Solirubrobacterales bacterium]